MGCNTSMICPHCQDRAGQYLGKKHECWRIKYRPPILFPILGRDWETTPSGDFKIKVPVNDSYTIFKWSKTQNRKLEKGIKSMSAVEIGSKDFQTKLFWFRSNIEELRIPWEQGCDFLKVDRRNLLMSSLAGLENLNLRREIKIQFDDEKVEDAGGLLRQWMHLAMQEVFSQELGIMELCDTEETAYKIKWDEGLPEDFFCEYLYILGLIIGKALFQRIPLNCFLNRTILRQICRQPVHMHDVFSFDKDFYKQWSEMLINQNVEDLGLDFCVFHTNKSTNKTDQFQLMENGTQIMLTDKNKYRYISEIINLFCTKSIQPYLQALCDGIFRVIPPKYLAVFEPYELEMMMNGQQEIDIEDWRNHTIYDHYSPHEPYIQKFWQIIEGYSQQKRAILLHYCTGSRSVPIQGFKYLESNRNTLSKFNIRKVELNLANPFPKSYTCFNRLELPRYSSAEELKEKLDIIVQQELNNFGLD